MAGKSISNLIIMRKTLSIIFFVFTITNSFSQKITGENLNILICNSDSSNFKLSDFKPGEPFIRVNGRDQDVASYMVYPTIQGGGILQDRIKGNIFGAYMRRHVMLYGKGKSIFIDKIVLTDGTKIVGWRKFSIDLNN